MTASPPSSLLSFGEITATTNFIRLGTREACTVRSLYCTWSWTLYTLQSVSITNVILEVAHKSISLLCQCRNLEFESMYVFLLTWGVDQDSAISIRDDHSRFTIWSKSHIDLIRFFTVSMACIHQILINASCDKRNMTCTYEHYFIIFACDSHPNFKII